MFYRHLTFTYLYSHTGRHVTKVSAGLHHSLALTTNSQVFSWGSNSHGQLSQLEDMISPMRIKVLQSGARREKKKAMLIG